MRSTTALRSLALAAALLTPAILSPAAGTHQTIDQQNSAFDISGDVLAIGDYRWEPAGEDEEADWGIVRIFYRNQSSADGWELAAEVRSPTNATENFGRSLALDGDTLAVGAAYYVGRGHVYIYERNYDPAAPATPSPDNWGLVKVLESTYPTDGADKFGHALDLDDSTLVVGSPGTDYIGTDNGGAVFVYERNLGGADNWGEVTLDLGATTLFDHEGLGNSVAISGRHFLASSPYYTMATHRGRVLVFERTDASYLGWHVKQELDPSPVPSIASYLGGGQLALDGTTAAVGAQYHDAFCPAANPDCNAGAAFVFELDPVTDQFTQVAALGVPPPGNEGYYGFGHTVSLSGENLVISPTRNANGLLYHYRRNQGGADAWGLVRRLAAPDAAFKDRFGAKTALDGSTLLVYGDEYLGPQPGEALAYRLFVHLFTLEDTSWHQENKVQHSGASTNFSLPDYDVALDNDTLALGAKPDAAILSRNYDPAAPATPAAGNWGEMQDLIGPTGMTQFGYAADVSGDYAVVGDPIADGGAIGQQAGAAFVFFRPQGSSVWHQVAHLFDPAGESNDQFGRSVAIDGRRIVVGAQNDDIPVSGQPDVDDGGSALIFELRPVAAGLEWTFVEKISLEGADLDAFGFFGSSVAISGDRVAVGARGHTDNAGAAYVLERNQGGADSWGIVRKILPSDPGSDKQFGLDVSLDDNLLAVGSAAGAAYLFERNHDPAAPTVPAADNWGELRRIPAPTAGIGFGEAIDLDHDRLIVGASGDDEAAADAGAAYLFERNIGGMNNWGLETKLTAGDGAADDRFGYRVAIWQNVAAVAAPGEDDAASNAGSTYIFRGLDRAETDLSVTKADNGDAPLGGSFTYTITAANAGPDVAAGAAVVDYPPKDLTCTWTCAGAGGATCAAAGEGHLADSAYLPAGGTATYTLDCEVDSGAAGMLENTATIWTPLGATDPFTGDNSATESTDLVEEADVGISKSDHVNEVIPGETITYTIGSGNWGPSDVSGLTVTDVLPPQLESCAWTCEGFAGATCAASGSGSINDGSVSFPAGSWVIYTVTCTVESDAVGTISNTATVTPPAGVIDPDTDDHTSTDIDTVVTPGGCGAPDTRDLSGQEIDHQRTYEACVSIDAGNLRVVPAEGDVTLRAGDSIQLGEGFLVEEGCLLTVEIDPAMAP